MPRNWDDFTLAEKVNWLKRREIENLLIGVGIQPYDSESTDELREALLANLVDGTITPEDIHTESYKEFVRRYHG